MAEKVNYTGDYACGFCGRTFRIEQQAEFLHHQEAHISAGDTSHHNNTPVTQDKQEPKPTTKEHMIRAIVMQLRNAEMNPRADYQKYAESTYGALANHFDALYQPRLAALQQRVEELEDALEADATDLWKVTTAIKKEIEARDWILEGRGSYEWNDDRYRQEAKWAFEAVIKILMDVREPARNRYHEVMNKAALESQLKPVSGWESLIKPFLVGYVMRIQEGLNPEYDKATERLIQVIKGGALASQESKGGTK